MAGFGWHPATGPRWATFAFSFPLPPGACALAIDWLGNQHTARTGTTLADTVESVHDTAEEAKKAAQAASGLTAWGQVVAVRPDGRVIGRFSGGILSPFGRR